jgi:hypothetical protein
MAVLGDPPRIGNAAGFDDYAERGLGAAAHRGQGARERPRESAAQAAVPEAEQEVASRRLVVLQSR